MNKKYEIAIWIMKPTDLEFHYERTEKKEALAVYKALSEINKCQKNSLQLVIYEIDDPIKSDDYYNVYCHRKAPHERNNLDDLPQSIKDEFSDLIEYDNQVQNTQGQ